MDAATLSRIGLAELAVMGQNLALNIADKGFPISVYNRSPSKTGETLARAAAEGSLPLSGQTISVRERCGGVQPRREAWGSRESCELERVSHGSSVGCPQSNSPSASPDLPLCPDLAVGMGAARNHRISALLVGFVGPKTSQISGCSSPEPFKAFQRNLKVQVCSQSRCGASGSDGSGFGGPKFADRTARMTGSRGGGLGRRGGFSGSGGCNSRSQRR